MVMLLKEPADSIEIGANMRVVVVVVKLEYFVILFAALSAASPAYDDVSYIRVCVNQRMYPRRSRPKPAVFLSTRESESRRLVDYRRY